MSSDEEILVGELKVVYDFVTRAKFRKAFGVLQKLLQQNTPELTDAPKCVDDKDSLEELFLFVVSKYADQLEQEEKFQQVFDIIEQGLELFPEHPELLNETGVRLQRYGRSLEASICFERVLLQDPKYLKAYQNLQNTKCELVERWHFRMLNDVVRNAAYRAAIQNQIKAGHCEMLDIGTGTGLLSLYALNCEGIRKVAACDGSEIMVQIARDVFGANGLSDRICLFQSFSQDLKIGDKFSLIVTETLDSGAFGEGILETLIHAKRNLLFPEGRIIPSQVSLHVSGYTSRALTSSNILINEVFSSDFNLPSNCLISKEGIKCYDAEDVSRIKANDDFLFVTDTVCAITVDFNDLECLERWQEGLEEGQFELVCSDDGILDGFVVWFDLFLDEENKISTDPTANTCWNQAIFKLNQRLPVTKDQRLTLTMTCKDGALALSHNLNSMDNQISIDEHVLEFLNDSEYYNKLTTDIEVLEDLDKVLDLSLFPYAGLKLLKEGKTSVLFCLDRSEDLIEFLANQNDIPMSAIMLLSSLPEAFLLSDYTLDLIILQPVDVFGQMNSEHFCQYQSLYPKLKPTGSIIPSLVELHGSVIRSDWIVKCCRVENPELHKFHIGRYLSTLETENHLDLGPFTYENLSEPTKLAAVHFDGKLHEVGKELSLDVPTDAKHIHAILYYYQIEFVPQKEFLSTQRGQSFAKRSAFIIPKDAFQSAAMMQEGEEQEDDADGDQSLTKVEKVNINIVQNHGVIKCNLFDCQ
ncbi:protein arginine N-methyltransferase 9-like [Toxorhynchites rutilus septentrionalis]|uniref:protein arginine N-methyltransferase 9-like n=1 Tax=Toxorhynchites rutilus septentrionalis TaxID=329112 RepID=UPI00247A280E|nr:protein arginine N-methyltransferase 9-like [Toxorhynchites rutilus septentrionalis]